MFDDNPLSLERFTPDCLVSYYSKFATLPQENAIHNFKDL